MGPPTNPTTTGMVLQRASPGNGTPKNIWMLNFMKFPYAPYWVVWLQAKFLEIAHESYDSVAAWLACEVLTSHRRTKSLSCYTSCQSSLFFQSFFPKIVCSIRLSAAIKYQKKKRLPSKLRMARRCWLFQARKTTQAAEAKEQMETFRTKWQNIKWLKRR
jgi:hypothetical protein